MQLKRIHGDFSVCKVESVRPWDLEGEFCFIGKTDEELSLVCKTEEVPPHTLKRDDGWRGFCICGVLSFSLIGILARLSAILAQNHIGIFAVSTYNTDYIFVKEKNFARAMAALAAEGYTVREG